jgi:hypothetical protein
MVILIPGYKIILFVKAGNLSSKKWFKIYPGTGIAEKVSAVHYCSSTSIAISRPVIRLDVQSYRSIIAPSLDWSNDQE